MKAFKDFMKKRWPVILAGAVVVLVGLVVFGVIPNPFARHPSDTSSVVGSGDTTGRTGSDRGSDSSDTGRPSGLAFIRAEDIAWRGYVLLRESGPDDAVRASLSRVTGVPIPTVAPDRVTPAPVPGSAADVARTLGGKIDEIADGIRVIKEGQVTMSGRIDGIDTRVGKIESRLTAVETAAGIAPPSTSTPGAVPPATGIAPAIPPASSPAGSVASPPATTPAPAPAPAAPSSTSPSAPPSGGASPSSGASPPAAPPPATPPPAPAGGTTTSL
ncbi:MAG: hypothetical protein AABZ06_09105 [Bdellovibrionota bacterium]